MTSRGNRKGKIFWDDKDKERLKTILERMKERYGYLLYAYIFMDNHQTVKELGMEEKKAIDLMAEVAEKAVKSVGDPSRVLMKVQILDWKSHEVIPKKEVEEILTGILKHGEVSLAFVPYIDQFPLYQLKGRWNSSK